MPAARDEILKSIRQHLPQSSPLPSLEGPWIRYNDPVAQYVDLMQVIGGQAFVCRNLAEVREKITMLPLWQHAKDRIVAVPGLPEGNIRFETIGDPHELGNLDISVLPGEYAVAENGAVWVNDVKLRHRVAYFICEHLILVVPRSRLRHNMHEVYKELTIGERQFGAFIAGPSKTADIEQSLVIGAHGPRSHTVFLVDDATAP